MEPPDNDLQTLLSDPEALRRVKQLGHLLIPILAELYGDTIAVETAVDPDNGVACYAYEDFGFHVKVELLPSFHATQLGVIILVGRWYSGYRQALRWCANNRACNTVALYVDDDLIRRSELKLSCMRISAPGDTEGLRAAFADIHDELGRVSEGLKMWFPHVLRGRILHLMEKDALYNEDTAALLADPNDLLEKARRHPDKEPSDHLLDACSWLKQWEEYLFHLQRRGPEEHDIIDNLYASDRVRALMQLNRHGELLAAIRELKEVGSEAEQPMYIGVEGHAPYHAGEYEEALDLLRSAELDEVPRVWFFRRLANAKIGHDEEALDCYHQYERRVGLDIIGRRKLAEIQPSITL